MAIIHIIFMLMISTFGRMTTTELGWLNYVLAVPIIYTLFAMPASIAGIIIAIMSSVLGIENRCEPKIVVILNIAAVIVHIIFMRYYGYLISIQ